MKVNFMVIGAMKCGTTTLCHILSEHPKISFYNGKEAHFFSKSTINKKTLNHYHQQFIPKPNCIYGEGSTSYTFHPHVNHSICEDLFNYNPDLKFIYLVRNPFERLISHYMHFFERGYTSLDLNNSIIKFPILIDAGRYAFQIERYINVFGRDKILVIKFEDLINNRQIVIKNISKFLNIDFDGFNDYENTWLNKSIGGEYRRDYRFDKLSRIWLTIGKIIPSKIRRKVWKRVSLNKNRKFEKKPSMTVKSKNILQEIYEKDIKELATITNIEFNDWLFNINS